MVDQKMKNNNYDIMISNYDIIISQEQKKGTNRLLH
jgi:hypothetical protein